MTILSINKRGELTGDWEKIVDLAESYDQGSRTPDACISKIYSLVFDRGYESAMEEVEEVHQRAYLLITHTGGHA